MGRITALKDEGLPPPGPVAPRSGAGLLALGPLPAAAPEPREPQAPLGLPQAQVEDDRALARMLALSVLAGIGAWIGVLALLI